MEAVQPKISIVTPSYNQANYIEQTILSVLDQGYPNLEYIVIDGGSTDGTRAILEKYAHRISYWASEPDLGQSDALNKGLAKCTGEIFNWLNSDDYLEPGSLFKIAGIFNETQADIVCGNCRLFLDSSNGTIQTHRTEIFASAEETLVQQKINQPAMFYRLNVIKELGGINTNLHYVMDLELFWRYLAQFGQDRIVLTDAMVAHFRLHDLSKTGAHEEKFRAEEKNVLAYVLRKISAGNDWTNYFSTKNTYENASWNFSKISREKLLNVLSEQYLYRIYASGNRSLARKAFAQQWRNSKVKFSVQQIAMFVKLYIGNIPFRKLLAKNG
ncbi:MAG: tuaG [Ferruginibacter sp.]|nr:tuaG [Ferruginibacter sp.]